MWKRDGQLLYFKSRSCLEMGIKTLHFSHPNPIHKHTHLTILWVKTMPLNTAISYSTHVAILPHYNSLSHKLKHNATKCHATITH